MLIKQLLGTKEFFRFVQIGVLNTIFGYGVFALIYLVTAQPNLSVITATIIGVIFNFFTTGRIVFGNRKVSVLASFLLGYCVTLGVNIVLLNVLLELGLSGLVAQALLLPITVVLSYLINSRIVFRSRVRTSDS